MRVQVDPREVEVGPVGAAVFTVEVYNTDDVIRAYDLRILGVDPDWCRITGDELSLFPGSSGRAVVMCEMPPDAPAGRHELAVQVVETTGSERSETIELVVMRDARASVELALHPPLATGGRRATVTMVVENTGNTTISLEPTAEDMEDKVTATFEPARIDLEPRTQQIVEARLVGPRPLLGMPEPRTVTLRLSGSDAGTGATATFIQRPWVGRALVAFIGLLVAATVFTFVLANGIDRVVDEAAVSDELLIQAMESEEAAEALAATPSSLSGQVTESLSGDPAAGVTVQIFDAGNDKVTIATAATDTDGGYEVTGIRGGTYRLRFVGDGFANSWFGPASSFDEAEDVTVDPGDAVDGLDIEIGARPGGAAGLVITTDPVGAVATLLLPGTSLGSDVDAVVEAADVAADGTFVFENVPSPANYRLEVTKPGFETVSRAVALGPGEEVSGIEIVLTTGDGIVSGSVTGPDGPIGGATVSATDGLSVVETATLTVGEPGAFSLRGLLTPGTYTVTVTADGFGEQVRTVALESGASVADLDFGLARNSGALRGTVSLADEGGIGGVTVTATDGEVALSTITEGSGEVGSWNISGVPSPGTYTVTFSGDGFVPQVRAVHLDPAEGDLVAGVDAVLTRSDAVLKGTVSDQGEPAPGIEVEVSDGEATFTTTTADDPAGRYELRGLPPGTYTATFRTAESITATVLVTLGPGEAKVLDQAMS